MSKWLKRTLKFGGNLTRLIPHLGIIWNIILAIIDTLDGDDNGNEKPSKKMLEQLLKRIKDLKQVIGDKDRTILNLKDEAERMDEVLEKHRKKLQDMEKEMDEKDKQLLQFYDPFGKIAYPTSEQINEIINLNTQQVNRLSEKRMIHCVRLMVLMMRMVSIGQKFNLDDGNVRAKVGHRNNSLHYDGLAQDINLYNSSWEYLTDTQDHNHNGAAWELMEGAWGGDFDEPDGNHYSTPIGDGRE